MTPEGRIQAEIQLALSGAGCTVFRNEVAGVWIGTPAGTTAKGDKLIRNARHIKAGLCTGSSDLIGWTKTGRFLAVEVKTKQGKATKEQLNFIEQVNQAGGIAGICRSAEDAMELISKSG